MIDFHDIELSILYDGWVNAGRPLPLEVSRSRYDDTTVSWEVLYTDSPWDGNSGCSTPIGEFPTWPMAQAWAEVQARTSTSTADSRCTLGPQTEYQQAHVEAWEAFSAGTGPHPFTTEHERWRLQG